MGRLIALAWLLAAPLAFAETPCPTVTDQASIIMMTVTGSPVPVTFATWDFYTNCLTVSFGDGTSRMFINVPRSAATTGRIEWNRLVTYHEALMQERSVCPILTESGSFLWTR